MFQRFINWIVSAVRQIWNFATLLIGVSITVGALLILSDVLFQTNFGILANAAKIFGTQPINVLVGGLVVYFLSTRK